jgi:basic membrane protein A
VRKPVLMAATAVLALVLAIVAAGCGGDDGGGSNEEIIVALISDVGRFNDKAFNQSQLEGLERAEADLGITALPLESRAVSDYKPNFNTAVRREADLIIAAGFLLANDTATLAKAYPDSMFAITDYPVEAEPFADKSGTVLFTNVLGLTYAAHESGCLVGVLAAKAAERDGGNVIGAVGGVKIPPVDIWIAGYKFCAERAVPGTEVLIDYSQDFVAADKCKTVAENMIARDAKVLFQVAGGCGLGTLNAADEAGIWGIGVDKDQKDDAERVLTSGVKRVDNGVYDAIKQVVDGEFAGGTDLLFNLENEGMDVGEIDESVPEEDIDLMNEYKEQIIAGDLEVPTALS